MARTLFLAVSLTLPTLGVANGEDLLEEVAVLSVSPVDGKAVIQLPSGRLRLLETGEQIPGCDAVLREVLPDRLVLEEPVAEPAPDESAEMRRIWLYKVELPGQNSRVQYLDRTPPEPAEVRHPKTEATTARPPPDEKGDQDHGSDGSEG